MAASRAGKGWVGGKDDALARAPPAGPARRPTGLTTPRAGPPPPAPPAARITSNTRRASSAARKRIAHPPGRRVPSDDENLAPDTVRSSARPAAGRRIAGSPARRPYARAAPIAHC
ncbi:hypothetical protein DID98_28105 [Burkholderia sp. Bp8984]|nr:hypothetical protein DID98_28105 [Burkholderia sp. Bp8984]